MRNFTLRAACLCFSNFFSLYSWYAFEIFTSFPTNILLNIKTASCWPDVVLSTSTTYLGLWLLLWRIFFKLLSCLLFKISYLTSKAKFSVR